MYRVVVIFDSNLLLVMSRLPFFRPLDQFRVANKLLSMGCDPRRYD
jgi:hypothetical protein